MAFAKSNYHSISSIVSFILTVFACGAQYLLLSAIDHCLEHVPKIKPYWSILAIQYLSIFPLDWTFAVFFTSVSIYLAGCLTNDWNCYCFNAPIKEVFTASSVHGGTKRSIVWSNWFP